MSLRRPRPTRLQAFGHALRGIGRLLRSSRNPVLE